MTTLSLTIREIDNKRPESKHRPSGCRLSKGESEWTITNLACPGSPSASGDEVE